MTKTLHIACGQIISEPGMIDANLGQIEKLAREASAKGSRLILHGEGAITGYLLTAENLKCAVSVGDETANKLLKLSKELNIVIAAGGIERADGNFHMSHFVAFPDGRIDVQRKHKLTGKELDAGLTPGPEERSIFEIDGVKFAIAICADSGIPDLVNKLARQGCELHLAPTAGGAGRDDMCVESDLDTEEGYAKYLDRMEKVCFVGNVLKECRSHRMVKMATNLSGDDGVSNYHPGHSFIVDSRGCLKGLVPGEYVKEFLSPKLLHAEVTLDTPVVCD